MKPTAALKDQAARFVRLFVLAFLAALAPAVIALKGPVDSKVIEAIVAGAAVGAAETAWRQLRPTVPAGSLVDVVQSALGQAKQRATAAQAELDRLQDLLAAPDAAAASSEIQAGTPAGPAPSTPVASSPIQL